MRTLRILMCLALITTCALAQSKKSDYERLAAVLAEGSTDVDYDLLRQACVSDSKHCEGVDSEQKVEMLKELQTGNKEGALSIAEKILKKNRAYLWANMVAWSSSNSLGLQDKAHYYDQIVKGLLHSIQRGGDGRSEQNPWNAVEVTEEYAALAALGYQPQGQSEVSRNGHHFDVMKVKDSRSEKEFDIYFNTDVIWSGYAKIFGSSNK